MSKYATRNWCEGWYWQPEDSVETTRECIEQYYDGFTGLFNAEGLPLYHQKQKIGFI